MYIINFIRGFCMALADSVPGVSGGTVAFLLGFYDQFIQSLDHLISGSKKEKIIAAKFLFKIGIGWIVGMLLSVVFMASIFDAQIYRISSLFLGFIVFAIPFVIMEEKESVRNHYGCLVFSVIGIAVVSAITYFNPISGTGINVDVQNLTFGLGIYVFIAGMTAISAMILPGISGSTLLLIFGLYVPIISSIKEVLSFKLNYLPVLIIFGLGVLTGIALVIKLIKNSLKKFRPQTIYLIIGLMIGSLYAIVMGPTTLEVPKTPMNFGSFNIIFFLIGGAVILGLQKLKTVLDRSTANQK